MKSERSRLSFEAVELVATLTQLGRAYEPLLRLFFLTLLELCTRTSKVLVARAQAAVTRVVEETRLPGVIPMLRDAVKDKSPTLRAIATSAIFHLMNVLAFNEFAHKVADIEDIIKTTSRDSNPAVRQTSRQIFDAYQQLFPDRVDAYASYFCPLLLLTNVGYSFTAPMTPTTRKYLAIKASSNPIPFKLAVPPTPAPQKSLQQSRSGPQANPPIAGMSNQDRTLKTQRSRGAMRVEVSQDPFSASTSTNFYPARSEPTPGGPQRTRTISAHAGGARPQAVLDAIRAANAAQAGASTAAALVDAPAPRRAGPQRVLAESQPAPEVERIVSGPIRRQRPITIIGTTSLTASNTEPIVLPQLQLHMDLSRSAPAPTTPVDQAPIRPDSAPAAVAQVYQEVAPAAVPEPAFFPAVAARPPPAPLAASRSEPVVHRAQRILVQAPQPPPLAPKEPTVEPSSRHAKVVQPVVPSEPPAPVYTANPPSRPPSRPESAASTASRARPGSAASTATRAKAPVSARPPVAGMQSRPPIAGMQSRPPASVAQPTSKAATDASRHARTASGSSALSASQQNAPNKISASTSTRPPSTEPRTGFVPRRNNTSGSISQPTAATLARAREAQEAREARERAAATKAASQTRAAWGTGKAKPVPSALAKNAGVAQILRERRKRAPVEVPLPPSPGAPPHEYPLPESRPSSRMEMIGASDMIGKSASGTTTLMLTVGSLEPGLETNEPQTLRNVLGFEPVPQVAVPDMHSASAVTALPQMQTAYAKENGAAQVLTHTPVNFKAATASAEQLLGAEAESARLILGQMNQ